MVYKYVTAEVEVDLKEFYTEDLLDEHDRRGYDYNDRYVDADEMRETLTRIWENRRLGKDYQEDLNKLIYGVLGKVI